MKEELQQKRCYREPDQVVINTIAPSSSDFDSYLSGFVTAEAWLGISEQAPGRFRPRMMVRLRADDQPLLEACRCATGSGRVYRVPPHGKQSPVCQWIVFSRRDLDAIVDRLDAVPPRGRRGIEYAIWRDAVKIYAESGAGKTVQPALRALHRELAAARAYAAPP